MEQNTRVFLRFFCVCRFGGSKCLSSSVRREVSFIANQKSRQKSYARGCKRRQINKGFVSKNICITQSAMKSRWPESRKDCLRERRQWILRLALTRGRAGGRGGRREQKRLIARGDGYSFIAAPRSPDLRLTEEHVGDTSVTVVTKNDLQPAAVLKNERSALPIVRTGTPEKKILFFSFFLCTERCTVSRYSGILIVLRRCTTFKKLVLKIKV